MGEARFVATITRKSIWRALRGSEITLEVTRSADQTMTLHQVERVRHGDDVVTFRRNYNDPS